MFFKNSLKNEFPEQINISGIKFNIEVLLLDKKSSSLSIDKNVLKFRISNNLSKKEIEIHFNKLLNRIIKKIEKHSDKVKKSIIENDDEIFKRILEEGKFKFANEIYKIEISKIQGIKLVENTFLYNPKINFNKIRKGIIKLLIKRYTPRIFNYIKVLNDETYMFPITGFHLNDVKSKWGHCSFDNKIMLNLKLLNNVLIGICDFADKYNIKELDINHSKDFWNEVEKFSPNYKKIKLYLKESPPNLFETVNNFQINK